jgi:hypothetical protein
MGDARVSGFRGSSHTLKGVRNGTIHVAQKQFKNNRISTEEISANSRGKGKLRLFPLNEQSSSKETRLMQSCPIATVT